MKGSRLFIVHAFATLYMVGAIWFVQLAHYPLLHEVGAASFHAYQAKNVVVTGYAVAPVMLLEAFTGLLLLLRRPQFLDKTILVTLTAMIVVIWLSTFLLQVPQHDILVAGYDELAANKLVSTNWIRTVGWTLRGLLLSCALGTCFRAINDPSE